MPQQPIAVHGLQASQLHSNINLLIDNLVNIKDTTGKFLLQLEDGRVIDTKGWNDWECVSLPAVNGISLMRVTSVPGGPMESVYTAYGNTMPSPAPTRHYRPQ